MIRDALAAMVAVRAQTFAFLAPLSQPQLDFTPGPRRWSIGEVADHLLLAEGLYREEIERLVALARAGRRPYLRRTFDDVNVAPLYLPTAVLTLFQAPLTLMSRVMPDQVRSLVTLFPLVPTRNPDRATPRHGRPGPELRGALARSIAETRAVVEDNADLDFSRMFSDHPLTGESSVPQTLRFLSLHERRHQAQMERVRSSSRFPRS